MRVWKSAGPFLLQRLLTLALNLRQAKQMAQGQRQMETIK